MKISKDEYKNIITLAVIILGLFWLSQNLIYVGNVINWFFDITSPLIIAGVIAFIINIIMNRFEKLIDTLFHKYNAIIKFKRPISLIISFLIITTIITLMLSIVIPELFNSFSMLANSIPEGFDKMVMWAKKYSNKYPQVQLWLEQLNPDWVQIAQQIFDYSKTGLFGVFGTTFSLITSVAEVTFTFIMSLILSIYILLSKEKLKDQVNRFMTAYFPEKVKNTILHIVSVANDSFSNFIIGKIIDAIVVGVFCAIGMLLLQIPYPAMIGAIVGVTAIIPIIGGYIGLVIGAFLILMINPIQSLKFVIFLMIMHTFEGNIIYPKIIGNTVGLPPMWILAAITLGGALFGVIGMVIAVPFVSTIYTLVGESINKRLEKKITVDPDMSEIIINKKDE